MKNKLLAIGRAILEISPDGYVIGSSIDENLPQYKLVSCLAEFDLLHRKSVRLEIVLEHDTDFDANMMTPDERYSKYHCIFGQPLMVLSNNNSLMEYYKDSDGIVHLKAIHVLGQDISSNNSSRATG